jgi:hypothetical protein
VDGGVVDRLLSSGWILNEVELGDVKDTSPCEATEEYSAAVTERS